VTDGRTRLVVLSGGLEATHLKIGLEAFDDVVWQRPL
jgi:hypothetical protein